MASLTVELLAISCGIMRFDTPIQHSSLVMERRAKRIASARLRRVVQMDEAYRLGDELPTGIRRYRSKNELLSSIRSVMDKVDAE